jgi:aminopeptidase N
LLNRNRHLLLCISLLASLAACDAPDRDAAATAARDPHSFARPDEVAVTHLSLDVDVDFERRVIEGRAALRVDRRTASNELRLDTRGLDIAAVYLDDEQHPATFRFGEEREWVGRPLIVEIDDETREVLVDYASRPDAGALQWLEPRQTSGGRHPFLLSQSQAILARTWIPCQDTPGVRMTYDATVRVPPGLEAVMSAERVAADVAGGAYRFEMREPIPSYLLAIAVGELEFRPLGPRTGVWAEPEVIDAATWEFADTEEMMRTTEELYGPYRWGRFDIVVLPSSFPFGGMENPRMTFVTPTLIAGDRSLVATIAHELAHSWSGNLVTNATWDDFWLNEGFTTYFELRIMEALYGREYSEMLALITRQDMLDVFEEIGTDDPDTRLKLDLAGRDPDDNANVVYEKGYLFLRLLEERIGREDWDAFLAGYLERHAFESMTTTRFLDELQAELLDPLGIDDEDLGVASWVHGTGLPDNAPLPVSSAFSDVDTQLAAWTGGGAVTALQTGGWSSHEWVRFLRGLPADLDVERMAELDAAFDLTGSRNYEVLHAWLMRAVAHGYRPADEALEAFLLGVGRLKFLRPLYRQLATTPEGRKRARQVYERARAGYHPMAVSSIERVLQTAPEAR